jgi:hypothetical protein
MGTKALNALQHNWGGSQVPDGQMFGHHGDAEGLSLC